MIWALHGAMGVPADWAEISRLLAAKGHTVRAVDLYRYQDCSPMSLDEFGRAFCEEVAVVDDSPVLLGYSMGGRLGLHALAAQPDLWQAAIFISTHPGLTDEQEKIMRMARDAEWAAKALQSDWDDFLKEWDAQQVLAGHPAGDRSALRLRKTEVIRSMMEWTLGKQTDFREMLAQSTVPITWLTGGDDDKFTTLAAGLAIDNKAVVPNAGHRLHLEAPKAIANAVASTIESRER